MLKGIESDLPREEGMAGYDDSSLLPFNACGTGRFRPLTNIIRDRRDQHEIPLPIV